MEKIVKDLIDYDKKLNGFQKNPLKITGSKTIVIPKDDKPTAESIWHMKHVPYQY